MRNLYYMFAICGMLLCYNVYASSIILQPDEVTGKDSYIASNFAGNNYNSGILLTRGIASSTIYSLIQFDVSTLPSDVIVTSAIMEIKTYNAVSGVMIDAYKITSDWTESVVDWSTQPTIDISTPIVNDMPSPSADKWIAWDITAFVKDWNSGTSNNYGVELRHGADATAPDYGLRSSGYSISSDRPKLTIMYTTVPEPATLLLLGLGIIGLVRRKLKK